MYKEEKIINGVLCFRGDPNGEFQPYTIEELSQKVKELKDENRELRNDIFNLNEQIDDLEWTN